MSCLFGLLAVSAAPADDILANWFHGAAGYDEALKKASQEEQPLIVYFHAQWCQFSKQLNEEYLPDPDINAYLSKLTRVEIDPDTGDREKALCAGEYQVTAFPAFLVMVPALNPEPKKLTPFKTGSDDWLPKEFLARIKAAIADFYDAAAFTVGNTGDHEKALKYLEHAVAYCPEDKYAYGAMGGCYMALGEKKKSLDLFKKAESSFAKAVEINPKDDRSQRGLMDAREILRRVEALKQTRAQQQQRKPQAAPPSPSPPPSPAPTSPSSSGHAPENSGK